MPRCKPCPSGAICNGGWDLPVPARGYGAKMRKISRRELREDPRIFTFPRGARAFAPVSDGGVPPL